ncbi:MAG TPA: hypothetical protein VLM39_13145, partial [Ignavibacteriaceae bacterium]|nr:hypothetical protein [Ignavibacteriaceae bacterium]
EKLRLLSALVSYTLTMAALFIILSIATSLLPGKDVFGFIVDSISTGIPGVIIIAAINITAVKFFQKNN